MRRKSVVPPAVLLAFVIVGAVSGIYGIIINDIGVMILSLGWILIGGAAAVVSNYILNRNR